MAWMRCTIVTRSIRFIGFQEQCLCQPLAQAPEASEFTQQSIKV